MNLLLEQGSEDGYQEKITTMLNTLYNWDIIAAQTVSEYKKLCKS